MTPVFPPADEKTEAQRGLSSPKATHLLRGVKPRLEAASARTCHPS